MEGASGRGASSAPPCRKGRPPPPWKDGQRRDPPRGAAQKAPAPAQKEGSEFESCLRSQEVGGVPFSKTSESFHQERCAVITRVVCEMLLKDFPAHQGCLGQVAAFILEREADDSQGPRKETYELVALGTGDVCSGGWMEFDGRKLHDLHSLVVARRALMRFLYMQLLLFGSQHPAALERGVLGRAEDGERLRLKPRCYLHLYLSQMPHGAVKKLHTTLLQPNPSVGPHVSVKGQLKPVSYCAPTTLSSHVYCASGSDKLTRWTVLGVQGALLSHFLYPVYVTSIVLADPYHSRDVLHRVINAPLQLGAGDGLPDPYCRRSIHLFQGPPVAPLGSPSECSSLSLNWCAGDEGLECVDGAVGKAQRDIANPGSESRPSRLCKAAMLKSFRKVAQEMKREDLLSLSTYHQAKVQAAAYQRAKVQLYTHLSAQDLSKWPQKQLVDNFGA